MICRDVQPAIARGCLCNETGTQPRKRAIARPAGMDSVGPPEKKRRERKGRKKKIRIRMCVRENEKLYESKCVEYGTKEKGGHEWRRAK